MPFPLQYTWEYLYFHRNNHVGHFDYLICQTLRGVWLPVDLHSDVDVTLIWSFFAVLPRSIASIYAMTTKPR